MESVRWCCQFISFKKLDTEQPKLYLQIRLNYLINLNLCTEFERKQIQRLYRWLSNKPKSFCPAQTSFELLIKRKKFKDDRRFIKLSKRFQVLKNFNRLNLEKEITSYVYGNPPKQCLDQMQIQLRTHSGEKYLLLKVNDICTNDRRADHKLKVSKNELKKVTIKKNELVVSLDFLFFIFKSLNNHPLLIDQLNDSFVLELTGYKFKTILILIYALYTNQLYLNLNTFPKIVQLSLDLGIEQTLRFVNKLILNEDPIYLLFKLRKYLNDLSHLSEITDLSALANLSKQMAYILRQVMTNYDKLINYPGILDLKYNEINFLVWKKQEIFRAFKVNVIRNELDVIKAILDWYLIEKNDREEQCFCLLNKIDYDNLTNEQLNKLINHFLLNKYSDNIRLFLKCEFNCELKKRKQYLDFFQDLPTAKQIDNCMNEMKNNAEKVRKSFDEINLDLKNQVEQETEKDKILEMKEQLNDFLKNLIHLGSFSLITSSSPIYSINDKSIMILLGGFKSYMPYPKDQGRLMYHLIRTQLDDNSIQITLPSLLTHDWFPLQERLPKNLAHFASIRILNCIFVLGGLDLNFLLLNNQRKRIKPISNCYVFNLTTSNWYKIKSMNLNRAFHSATFCENLIYVFGGISYSNNNLSINNSMEFYDINKNNWFIVTIDHNSLSPGPRMAFGMELIDKNTICIIGGISSIEDKNLNFNSTSLLDDFWCFNLTSKTFKQLNNLCLPNSRASFGLIKHQNELLLIGGLEIAKCSNLTACNMNAVSGISKNLPITTNSVLACRLADNRANKNFNSEQKLEQKVQSLSNSSCWYSHSKLNRQRIFPLVSKCLNTIMVAGGKTQDHFYLRNISLTNYCSTYEVFNHEAIKWVESPIMFATFGSTLISLI